MIKAVVFDLDDTLVPEIEYVKSGFRAVAEVMGDKGLYDKLSALFKENPKDVYQRAGMSDEECKRCIEVYRNHIPDISLSGEVSDTLTVLKSKGMKLGIITDGRPVGQRNKIKALGLDRIMDYVIVTDELGAEEFRKPNQKAFEIMKEKLRVEYDEMMYVGDNPQKDFYIGSIYPIYTVRLMCNGLYSDTSYYGNVMPVLCIESMRALIDF